MLKMPRCVPPEQLLSGEKGIASVPFAKSQSFSRGWYAERERLGSVLV